MGIGSCVGGNPKNRSLRIVIPWEPYDLKEKWCPQCRFWVLISDFYLDASRDDGIATRCKKCDNAYRAKKYRNKKERETKKVGHSIP